MKQISNTYILLFECCQLIKGYSRTCLIDFQRQKFDILDNEIYDIFINKSREFTIEEILNSYPSEIRQIVWEYFDFLLNEEYAFVCSKDEVDLFPKLDLSWDHPALLTNCIIDFDRIPNNIDPYFMFINDLSECGCENIQIRVFGELPLSFLKQFLRYFDKTIIYRIELLLKFTDTLRGYKELLYDFPRVNEIILHSSHRNSIISTNTSQKMILTKQTITDKSCCGIISPKYFNLRLEHYLESNHHNTCLNRKIGIDTNGNIKNCPSLTNTFGTIYNARIQDILKKKDFVKMWNIKKDNVEVCKDCEFRHICTDCRAYLDSDYSFKKPFKCNYNPYIACE